MKKYLLFLMVWCLLAEAVRGQVEQLIVETYYISDSRDATDEDGGILEEGTTTYRIYLDLATDNKLVAIYGNKSHALKFSSTESFFNNIYRDKTFGYQINKSNLDNNTMALDSWLTIGFASNSHFGILKSEDSDTSIVGGINNDGGSMNVPGGLLINNDSKAGIPLTISDGLIPSTISTTGFFHFNILSENGDDSTIFGALANKKELISHDARLFYSQGISGPNPDNKILIAQLTTKGALSFELNIEVLKGDGTTINYVASEPVIGVDTFYSRWLSYPFLCGCTDPDYLEYDKNAGCDNGTCATPVIFGCTDPAACNYDPSANKNLPELCCFNSQCALELDLVCPETIYGCTDPNALNYNPDATATSNLDDCCYIGGCLDSLYREYNPLACFDDGSQCKVLKIKGCMDTDACNFNPFANISNPENCIFGCEEKSTLSSKRISETEIAVYPNPAYDYVTIEMTNSQISRLTFSVCDIYGKPILYENTAITNGIYRKTLDMTSFPAGVYILEIHGDEIHITRKIIKTPR